jgi:hypothetical protein
LVVTLQATSLSGQESNGGGGEAGAVGSSGTLAVAAAQALQAAQGVGGEDDGAADALGAVAYEADPGLRAMPGVEGTLRELNLYRPTPESPARPPLSHRPGPEAPRAADQVLAALGEAWCPDDLAGPGSAVGLRSEGPAPPASAASAPLDRAERILCERDSTAAASRLAKVAPQVPTPPAGVPDEKLRGGEDLAEVAGVQVGAAAGWELYLSEVAALTLGALGYRPLESRKQMSRRPANRSCFGLAWW